MLLEVLSALPFVDQRIPQGLVADLECVVWCSTGYRRSFSTVNQLGGKAMTEAFALSEVSPL